MLKPFLRDSAIYSLPGLVSRGIWVLLLPLLTRYLSPEEFGVVELFTIFFVLLNIVLTVEVAQGVARLMPDAPTIEGKSDYGSTGFWFTAGMFCLLLIVCLTFSNAISLILFSATQFAFEVRVSGLSMLASGLFLTINNQLRWALDSVNAAIGGIVTTLVAAIVTVVSLVIWNYGVASVLLGQLIGNAVGLAFCLYAAKASVPIRFTFKPLLLKELLSFSYPLVFSSASLYILTFADRILINHLMSTSDVGIYAIAVRVAAVITLLTGLVQSSINPLIMSSYKEKDTPSEVELIFSLFLSGIFCLLLFIFLFSKEIVLLLAGKSYAASIDLVLGVSVAAALMNMYYFAPGLGLKKKTKCIAALYVAAALLNLALNYLLIPVWSLEGAMYATLVTAAILTTCIFYLSHKEYPIPYRVKHYAAALGLFIAMVAAPVHQILFVRFAAWIAGSVLIAAVLIPKRRTLSALKSSPETETD